MDFPMLVYKGVGPYDRCGGTFDTSPVENDADLSAALANGWFLTLPEAIDAYDNKGETVADDQIDLISAPTRAELEQKADELGIKYDGRTSDAKLLERINEAMEIM